ncbi:MAG: glutathione S-transferase family protein [Sandaracinaceae bacterium]
MSKVTLFGVPASSYVRSARIACAEKGVEHTLETVELGSPAHRARHPFVRVPAMQHGDHRIYETNAIVHYLDRAFDSGTRLIPNRALEAARAEQWISVLNCYAYDHLVRQYAFAYIRPAANGPDRARIDGAMELVNEDLDLLEGQLKGTKFLAGDTFSHADVLWAPVIGTIAMFPEGKAAVGARAKLGAWLGTVASRPSARFLDPEAK